MSARWRLYVASFILAAALIVIGFSQANTPLIIAGLVIGAVHFFARKRIQ